MGVRRPLRAGRPRGGRAPYGARPLPHPGYRLHDRLRPVTEIEIGRAKRGRRAYSFDDIAIVPVAAHPRPRGGQRRLADRRLPVRAAGAGRPHGLGDVAGDRDRASASSAGSACSTSRGSGRGTTTRPTCSRRSPGCTGGDATRRMQEIYAEPIKAELITARLKRDPRRRRDGGRLAVAAADQGVRQGRGRRRGRHVRHPRHHRQRRARLLPGRAAQPQGVHLRARRPGHRRRLRDLPGRPAPDAHRRGRGARRLRRRRRPHDAHGARHRRARWPAPSPTSPPPAATTSTSRAAATSTSSPTARSAAPATSPRRSPAAPTR